MELHEVDGRMQRDAAGFIEGCIHEHRDARDERGQRGDPRGVFIQVDVALRAGEEIEAERVGTEHRGGDGIGPVGDSANFDADRCAHARGSESTTRPSTRLMPSTLSVRRTAMCCCVSLVPMMAFRNQLTMLTTIEPKNAVQNPST